MQEPQQIPLDITWVCLDDGTGVRALPTCLHKNGVMVIQ
jgi:hypothetical protein